MPAWNNILDEIKATDGRHDIIRRKYLSDLYDLTGRNTIIYYSGWLQKGDLAKTGLGGFSIDDDDKNGFMSTIHGLDRGKGLDLILHTPGGSMAATESLVDYLRSMFNNDIRAIIPQIAMSAGTMVACSCKEIIMGEHSSIGPIDPQINGTPAHGIIEEFDQAHKEIKADNSKIPLWQPIIAKYNPTLIGECQKAIKWSEKMVREWLLTGMFEDDPNAETKVDEIMKQLSDHSHTKSHSRHISIDKAIKMGLKVIKLEEHDDLQEAVLTVHHSSMLTLAQTNTFKLIENHEGSAYAKHVNTGRN